MNWGSRRVLLEPARNWKTSNSSTGANLSRRCCSCLKIVGDTTKQALIAEDGVPPTGLHGFVAKFTVIFGARRELWLTFLLKFLIYVAYSVTNKTMVLWL